MFVVWFVLCVCLFCGLCLDRVVVLCVFVLCLNKTHRVFVVVWFQGRFLYCVFCVRYCLSVLCRLYCAVCIVCAVVFFWWFFPGIVLCFVCCIVCVVVVCIVCCV